MFHVNVPRLADRPIRIAADNEWSSDPRFLRVRDRAALIELMVPVLRQRSRAEWMAGPEQVGVPCSPVNDIPELAASEQLAAVDLLRTLPGSELRVVGLPIVFDGERLHPAPPRPNSANITKKCWARGRPRRSNKQISDSRR